MTIHSPQTTAHGEVIEIRSQVAPAQDGASEAVPAYYTPDTLIDDLMDELAEAREMVVYLTRANEALTAQLDSTLKDRALIIADRDRLREALKPFAFFFDDDGEAKTVQQAWEIIYRDRVEDWVFFQEIVAARAALKGETP